MSSNRMQEIAVRVVPLAGESSQSTSSVMSRYEAQLFTALPLIDPVIDRRERPRTPKSLGDLPFVGTLPIAIRWYRYDQYLDQYHLGDKFNAEMRQRLWEAAPALAQVLGGLPNDWPIRVWWSNENVELEDLPWELFTERGNLSFVRGRPAERRPLLPLEGPIKVAVLDTNGRCPAALRSALSTLVHPPVEMLTAGSLDQIEQLQQYDVLHIIAGGTLSIAGDGLLDFGTAERENECLSPKGLRILLRGSRVGVVSLSGPEDPSAYPMLYRAFARFGAAEPDGPTVVAPLAPSPAEPAFWREFYRQLTETLGAADAVKRVRSGIAEYPTALFLRQRLGREFTRRARKSVFESDLGAVSATVNESDFLKDYLAKLNAVDQRFPDAGGKVTNSELVGAHRQRAEEIETSLAPFRVLEEDE